MTKLVELLEQLEDDGAPRDDADVFAAAMSRARTMRRHRHARQTLGALIAVAIVATTIIVATGGSTHRRGGVVITTPTPSVTTTPPVDQRNSIAFWHDYTIFTVQPNGAAVRPISPRSCCTGPAWNPAHTLLAIGWDETNLTIMRPDGRVVRRFDGFSISPPAWSPD